MKIVQLHNYYQQSGGEDRVVEAEAELLRSRGHLVELYSVRNDGITGPISKLRTAWNLSYSAIARDRLRAALRRLRPDLVHVHNFFPLLTPAVYDACRDAGVPVIQTLHNYRTICPGAYLLRDGQICEACLNGSAYQAVRHGCYRGSRLETLPVAHMVETHRRQGTWHQKVDRFIALTPFARDKFIAAGFPGDRMIVKPNFCMDRATATSSGLRQGALFVGRLSAEKGIRTLLAAWQSLDVPLSIIGDGPLADMIHAAALPSVTLLGRKTPGEIALEMERAAMLIMPSEWYETFGLVLIEAFCHGLPVIASRLGAMADLVTDGQTGLLFEDRNPHDLAAKVRWMMDHPAETAAMGARARLEYQARYTPEANYAQLWSIYEQALEQRHPPQASRR